MNKRVVLTLIVAGISIISCATQKAEQPKQSESNTTTAASEDDNGSSISVIDFSNSKPRTYNIEPFQMMNIEAGFPKFITRDMDNRLVETYYMGRTDEVYLRYKYETSMNELYLNVAGRTIIRNAVDLYFTEFDNRKLIEDEYKTRYAYGKFNARLRWGAFQMRADAEPEIQCGYKFHQKNPYFVIVVKSADNTNVNSADMIESNIEMTLYFTKAQALALKDALSDEYILQELSKQDIPEASNTPDKY